MASTLNSVIGALRANLSLDSAQFQRGLKGAQTNLQRFSKGVGIAMAGVAAAGATAFAAFNTSANRMGELKSQAEMAGVAAKEMQILGFAAAEFGVSQEQLADNLKDVNDKIGDFVATGAGPMKDFFEQIGPKVGVTIKDFENLSSSEALSLYVTSLEKAGVSAAEMTFYMEAMVNDGTKLVKVFGNNGAAIDAARKKAEEYGLTLDEALVGSSSTVKQEMAIMGTAIRNAFDQAILASGPAIAKTFKTLAPVIKTLAEGFGQVIAKVAEAAEWFASLDPHTQKVAAGIAAVTVVIGPFVAGFGLMVAGIGPLVAAMGTVVVAIKAISLALLTNPIGLAVAAIAGAAYLIYQNWDQVKAFFITLWEAVKNIFNGFVEFIRSIFSGNLSGAVDALKAIWNGYVEYWSALWEGIKSVLQAAWDGVIKPILDAFGVTDTIISAWNSVKETFKNVLDAVVTYFQESWEKIKSYVDKLKEAANFLNNLPQRASGVTDGPISTQGPGYVEGNGGNPIVPPTSGYKSGSGAGKSYLDGFDDATDINSPSGEMMKRGQYLNQGLQIGLADTEMLAIEQAESLSDKIQDTIGEGIKGVVKGTVSLKEAFRQTLAKIGEMLIDSGIDKLMQNIFGGGSGGGGLLSSVFNSVVGAIGGGRTVVGTDSLSNALAGATGFKQIPGFAKGTNGAGAGLAWVGENGPEIMNLRAGTQIMNNKKTNDLLAGVNNSNSPSKVEINLSAGLEERFLGKADNRAISITRNEINNFSRTGLSDAIERHNGDRKRR